MKNLGSEPSVPPKYAPQKSSPELSAPTRLPSVFTVVDQGGKSPKQGGLLLELRTENGPVYVRPSLWQRLRLRRAFRYFHVVPPQLLSRGQQRLVAKLLRTAVVTPQGRVAGNAVFGVVQSVQKVHAKSLAEALPEAVGQANVRQEIVEPAIVGPVPAPATPIQPRPGTKKEQATAPSPLAAFGVREPGLWPWIVSGAAAAAFIPLIMASVYGISLLSSTPPVKDVQAAASPIQNVAKDRTRGLEAATSGLVPVVPPGDPLAAPKRKHRAVTDTASATGLNAEAGPDAKTLLAEPAAHPQTRFVSELPPGHFAHPVARNLVGEVRLKALIGADGSVKQVTVLSGNPKLAQAAMQAVMRWHYSPYEVMGDPVTVETEVKMSFFGPDAVSIASVADRPAASPIK